MLQQRNNIVGKNVGIGIGSSKQEANGQQTKSKTEIPRAIPRGTHAGKRETERERQRVLDALDYPSLQLRRILLGEQHGERTIPMSWAP